jgi:hypothetical protein
MRCSPSPHAGRAAREDIAALWPAARALLSEAHPRERTDRDGRGVARRRRA